MILAYKQKPSLALRNEIWEESYQYIGIYVLSINKSLHLTHVWNSEILADLIQGMGAQVARILNRYDAAKGTLYTTFLLRSLHRCFYRTLYEQTQLIRLPEHLRKMIGQIQPGQDVSGDVLSVTERYGHLTTVLSLDAEETDSYQTYHTDFSDRSSMVQDPATQVIEQCTLEDFRDFLKSAVRSGQLTALDYRIFSLRLDLDLPVQTCGCICGISRAGVYYRLYLIRRYLTRSGAFQKIFSP